MEAMWNMEDKWKLSTRQALFLLLFAASGIAGLCIAATKTIFLRRLRSRKSTTSSSQQLIVTAEEEEDQQQQLNNKIKNRNEKLGPGSCGWTGIKSVLMSSVRWSRASKWGGDTGLSGVVGPGDGVGRETPLPLLEKRGSSWPSRNSDSPVWQRPILMGEKCELPRFSGLILYDENGQLLCDVSRSETTSYKHVTPSDQEKTTAKVMRTTLRDLL